MNFSARIILTILILVLSLLASILISERAQARHRHRHHARPGPCAVGQTWEGTASWYGNEFNGRRTASGERFNQDALTAAHRTLPFNTIIRVCRVNQPDRCVDVRITDRGPFIHGRELDLSRAAAQEIECGLCKVRMEVVSCP